MLGSVLELGIRLMQKNNLGAFVVSVCNVQPMEGMDVHAMFTNWTSRSFFTLHILNEYLVCYGYCAIPIVMPCMIII